jgi:hypothetical protein
VLLANNLDIYILVVIFVESSGGERVADPQIDSLRDLLESYPCPRDVFFNM